jgi:trimethyllysine dioxygenase
VHPQPGRESDTSVSEPRGTDLKQQIRIRLGSEHREKFPSFWLRDHCLCDVCSHPSTHQRQHNTFALDPEIKAKDVSETPDGVKITWQGPDEHVSIFPWDWLKQHLPLPPRSKPKIKRHGQARQWTKFSGNSPRPQTPYPSLRGSNAAEGQKYLFSNIWEHGLVFLPETPPTTEATIEILNTLGPIRHTHYGGFWDFTSEVNPIDTAYTNLSLPLHTDNSYFTEPAGLQLFHLLSHMPSTTEAPQPGDFDSSLGGESTFSDGFAAAAALYRTDKKAYDTLANTGIVFTAEGSPAGTFRNDLSTLSRGHPVLGHNSTRANHAPDNLTQIRWNNCDRSALTRFSGHDVMLEWYRAAKLWDELLSSGDFEVEVKLQPGEPVVFDNWRILHGRKKFEGKRRMCGAYIGMDDFKAGAGRLGVL